MMVLDAGREELPVGEHLCGGEGGGCGEGGGRVRIEGGVKHVVE